MGAVVISGAFHWIGKKYSGELQDELDHGGLLLWVQAPDETTENRAKDILARHQADLIGTHEVPNQHTKRDMLLRVFFVPFTVIRYQPSQSIQKEKPSGLRLRVFLFKHYLKWKSLHDFCNTLVNPTLEKGTFLV